ncbi:acetate uptake transporter [Pelovirga terrestris]|uniref:Acetate uptake transporter n=1 Tax=Pelovirga terrestris TaxID=2771352 RepID=A0A8J6UL00_9BACT|nr:acetate uptake transporter [Pelovirga terrestris]MBD1400322.1 acetate uptake transporter [Pelovirga terrestris]
MTAPAPQAIQHELPTPALLALAASLLIYLFSLLGPYRPPVLLSGIILVCGGVIQLTYGLRSHQQGHPRAAATLLPFGFFWLSLISYEIFPELGLGRHPNAMTMFSYLSLWALFAAILFLGSFRRSIAVQTLYGAIMCSLLALSMNHLREDQVFLLLGCLCGFIASATAMYIAVAQTINESRGQDVIPLGHWNEEWEGEDK